MRAPSSCRGPFTTPRAGGATSVCLALTVGCAAPTPPPSSFSFAITGYAFPSVSPVCTGGGWGAPLSCGPMPSVPGRDLDARVGAASATDPCWAEDFVSELTGPGVDNQFLANLADLLHPSFATLDEAVAAQLAGAEVMVVTLTGVNGRSDLEVDASLERAYLRPAAGRPLAVVTAEPDGSPRARLADERVHIELDGWDLPLGEAGIETVHDATLLFDVLDPAAGVVERGTGELAAHTDVETVRRVAARLYDPIDASTATSIAQPDLDLDGDGTCEGISLGVGLALTRVAVSRTGP